MVITYYSIIVFLSAGIFHKSYSSDRLPLTFTSGRIIVPYSSTANYYSLRVLNTLDFGDAFHLEARFALEGYP